MASEYPGGPFSDIMEGFIGGWKSGLDIRKARNDLRLSDLAYDMAEKNSKMVGQGTGGGKAGSAYMDPANTGGGGMSGGSAGDPGSSTGRRGGGGGSSRVYRGSQEGGVDPGELSGYMKNQLGATDEELGVLVPAAAAESSFRPNITHDPDKDGNPTGYGMWGHRLDRLDNMYKFAGVRPGEAIPWQSQAAFALSELRSRPEGRELRPGMTPEQLTDVQMRFEVPDTKGPTRGNYDQRLGFTRSYLANPPQAQAIGAPDMATAGQGANAPDYRRAMEMPLPSERNRATLGPPSDSIPSMAEQGVPLTTPRPGAPGEFVGGPVTPPPGRARAPGQAMMGAPAAIGGNRYAALMRNPTNPWGASQPMTYGGDARNTTPIMPEYGGGVGGGSAMDFAAGSDPSPIVGLGNPPPAIGDRYQDYQRAPVLNDRQDYSSPGSPTGSDQWGEITGSGDPRRSSYGYRNGPDQFEVDPRGRYMYRRTYEY